jgi:hypothetical protein
MISLCMTIDAHQLCIIEKLVSFSSYDRVAALGSQHRRALAFLRLELLPGVSTFSGIPVGCPTFLLRGIEVSWTYYRLQLINVLEKLLCSM